MSEQLRALSGLVFASIVALTSLACGDTDNVVPAESGGASGSSASSAGGSAGASGSTQAGEPLVWDAHCIGWIK